MRLTTIASPVAERENGRADGNTDPNQDEAKAEGKRQIALTGLEHDCCRHRARIAGDVAADDQDGTHLGDGPSKSGKNGRENLNPSDGEQMRDGA